MNHLSAILDAYQQSQLDGCTAFLVTVVHTEGSTYRQVGARMLITTQSEMTGIVSGGCLEQDILCHVQQQTAPYHPFVITYDTTTDEDIVWGFGLGCNGVVRVLVECLDAKPGSHTLNFIAECFNQQQPGVLATVFGVEGNVGVEIGAHLNRYPDGSVDSTIANDELHRMMTTDAQVALQQNRTVHQQYRLPSGAVEALIEVIQPPPALTIFGAGRDVLPLAQFAKALGWHLTLVDCRSLETTCDRFPIADHIILTRRDVIDQHVSITKNTIAVVMTHNYHDDLAILTMLLASPAQYIGVLGSRPRTEQLLQALIQTSNIDLSKHLHRLHAPIGLDIGAETPEAIAIAIIAEIQAVLSDRPAGFLKHRSTPIHLPKPLNHLPELPTVAVF